MTTAVIRRRITRQIVAMPGIDLNQRVKAVRGWTRARVERHHAGVACAQAEPLTRWVVEVGQAERRRRRVAARVAIHELTGCARRVDEGGLMTTVGWKHWF